jgi:hypothetical protein
VLPYPHRRCPPHGFLPVAGELLFCLGFLVPRPKIRRPATLLHLCDSGPRAEFWRRLRVSFLLDMGETWQLCCRFHSSARVLANDTRRSLANWACSKDMVLVIVRK